MKLTQLSVFLENKPNAVRTPCRLLADANIDIRTLALADTEEFGILRLIVADPERAQQVLAAGGCVVNATEVLALSVPDRPGGLDEILAAIETAGLNVEYMYAFTARRGDEAIIVFRFEDPDRALATLPQQQVNVVASVDLLV